MLRLSLAFMPILKPQFAFPVLIALADHPSAVVTIAEMVAILALVLISIEMFVVFLH